MKTSEHVLVFISDFIQTNGYSPTIREIADGVGLSSTSTVHGHLDRLERAGKISRKTNTFRAIEVVGLKQRLEIHIIKHHGDIPSVIEWQGRRYIFDPKGARAK